MGQMAGQFPVEKMCGALGVSRSGYYAHQDKPRTPRRLRDESLKPKVRQSFARNDGRYGSPRILLDLRREGEWGPEPHALEPWWLRLHGAFAFLALWTFGFLWAAHILGGWASGRRRWTGVLLAAWLLVMATSGYLLLYAGDDGAWGVLSPTHWIAGLALPAIYLAHRFLRRGTA